MSPFSSMLQWQPRPRRLATLGLMLTVSGTALAPAPALAKALVAHPATAARKVVPPLSITITNVSPLTGGPGTLVTITGTGLSGANSVSFNGTQAPVQSKATDGTSLTVLVPARAITGPVSAIDPIGSPLAASAQSFAAVPYIDGNSGYGIGGQTAQFFGTNFTGATQVLIAGINAPITAVTDNQLTVRVPLTVAGTAASVSITTPTGTSQTSAPTLRIYPIITSVSPSPVTVGSTVTLNGGGFAAGTLTSVRFGCQGATSLTIISATQATAVVPPDACNLGLYYDGPSSGNISVPVRPTITTLSTLVGPVGSTVDVTLAGVTALSSSQLAFAFNGTPAPTVTQVGQNTFQVTVPAGATTGLLSVTSPGGTGNSSQNFVVGFPDLTVSIGTVAAPRAIPAGTYNSLTVTGTGVAQLAGNITVNGPIVVQDGGRLNDGCFTIGGSGSFTLADGGTLGICSLDGITSSGAAGAVQVTGARSFSTDASYVYTNSFPTPVNRAGTPVGGANSPTATLAGFTGNGLPARVRNLTAETGLSLSQAVAVTRVVNLTGSGAIGLNNMALLLPSTAAGTALVVNAGTGIITGTTATMQRYIGANTGGTGYRHYSSPMQSETLATLATTGYAPDFTGGVAYNASATPGLVTPFPTVFSYNEARTATVTSNYGAFDKGWQAAVIGSQLMNPGRGYSVNAPGTALVDFTGALNNGNVAVNNLTYTGADGGWQLLGNPYPAPLDWSTVPAANRPNMNAAMYVFQSSGPYAGQYRTYANGFGDPLIAAGSGFFVRTAAQGTAGSLTLTNANRITTFGTQPVFGRSAADPRPQVQLTLATAANTLADDLTVYADSAATPGADAEYDAAKLANPTGLNLSVVATGGAEQAIAGLPALTAATVLPLRLQVPAAGTYRLAATAANLPAGLVAYLRDQTAGTQTALTASTTLNLTAGLSTRYALAFAPAGALAATAGLSAAQVAVFPNPAAAGAGVNVSLPVAAGQQATAEVRDALGRVVLAARALRVSGGQATGELPTAGLAPGVYVLRLTAGTTAVSKQLVVE